LTRTGANAGLIGGYRQAGSTPTISRSPGLDEEIQRLYRQADAGEVVPA